MPLFKRSYQNQTQEQSFQCLTALSLKHHHGRYLHAASQPGAHNKSLFSQGELLLPLGLALKVTMQQRYQQEASLRPETNRQTLVSSEVIRNCSGTGACKVHFMSHLFMTEIKMILNSIYAFARRASTGT